MLSPYEFWLINQFPYLQQQLKLENINFSESTAKQMEIEILKKEIQSLRLQLAQEIQNQKIEETVLYADNRLIYRAEYNNLEQRPSDQYQSHSEIPEEIVVQKEEPNKIKKMDIISMIILFAIFCSIYFIVMACIGRVGAKVIMAILGVGLYEFEKRN